MLKPPLTHRANRRSTRPTIAPANKPKDIAADLLCYATAQTESVSGVLVPAAFANVIRQVTVRLLDLSYAGRDAPESEQRRVILIATEAALAVVSRGGS